MKNWAKNISFKPQQVFSPKSEDEIIEIIKQANSNKKVLRTRGSGHSWTGLIASDYWFLHLDHFQGFLSHNQDKKTLRVKAGTKLRTFGDIAFKFNLAMENQGDINRQSLAGASSTGTHGTGRELQSVANQIESLVIISGSGDKIKIDSSNLDLFNAARVSFGSLGIITEVTMKLVEAYKLKVRSFAEDMDKALDQFDKRFHNHRHLEMFYFPVGDWAIIKTMDKTSEIISEGKLARRFNELVLENWIYEGLNIVASKTKSYKEFDKIMRRFVGSSEKVDWSHRAFPTDRNFKFMEMEYNLPLEKFQEVFNEMRQSIRKNNFKTLFPIEIRFVKKDPLWLSPAFERDSVYFAVHTYITEDYRPYFDAMEAIFKRHGGRPHWGKWHSLKEPTFAQIYPKFENFKKIRTELDPQGIFLNPHLKEIFGV
jgi:FAD-linked oxidoreductase